ncbi:LytR family transcriptional attenuator [Propionicimonas paludicola]|uniref:LytR family transcriptional attenuator n=1 Tax=Propionicimonas paludicola TaxID=185243 RepID=A0A2A9CQU2_9ACTN|nr:LCP family protein [Propionicimonas paludicola]PFG15909.1 LytR family transcriptional attenuator [Propionicimonas paludicola]
MSENASALPSPTVRSQGIALRRGVVLTLFSALLPGSAQVVAGNRRLGRAVLRFLLIVVAVLVVVGLLAALIAPLRNLLLGFLLGSIPLRIIQWGVLAWALVWVALLVDAWRLANPRVMSVAGKLISGTLAVALAAGGGTAAVAISRSVGSLAGLSDSVLIGGGSNKANAGRINVLLLGGDAGKGREGLRPDSMTVASIDAETGRTVLFSLPRNLQKVPFPADSPLHKLYPNGYYCHVKNLANACMLNGIYTLAMTHKSLFPGDKNPGVTATQSAIEETLGLKINYWAMVDLAGFQKLIDAVGGITLDVGVRVPMGSKETKGGIKEWIEPGKGQHMDGRHALWFARSREGSTDYARMIRQKCVMNAMLKQLNPTTVFTRFSEIAEAGGQIVATNLPTSEVGTMLELAAKAKSLPMASVSFAPPMIVTWDPDFALIKQTVADTIAASEQADIKATAPPQTASPNSAPTSAGGVPSPKPTKPIKTSKTNKTDNLDAICKA